MVEHLIKTWEMANGSWDVTHHSDAYNKRYLWDNPNNFKNLPTRDEADKYAKKLFKRYSRGNNRVRLISPDYMGTQILDKEEKYIGWGAHKGPRFYWEFENGKITKEESEMIVQANVVKETTTTSE